MEGLSKTSTVFHAVFCNSLLTRDLGYSVCQTLNVVSEGYVAAGFPPSDSVPPHFKVFF